MTNESLTTEATMNLVIEALTEVGVEVELNRTAPGQFNSTKLATWTDCYPSLAFNAQGEAIHGNVMPNESAGKPLETLGFWFNDEVVVKALLLAFEAAGLKAERSTYTQKVEVTF